MAAKAKTRTIDECLAALSDDKRAALEELRKTIRAAAPKAEECISYRLPLSVKTECSWPSAQPRTTAPSTS